MTVKKNIPHQPFYVFFPLPIYQITFNCMASSLLAVILPLQVINMVGEEHKSSTVGIFMGISSAINLFTGAIVGYLSDRTREFPIIGKRKPYIIVFTLLKYVKKKISDDN